MTGHTADPADRRLDDALSALQPPLPSDELRNAALSMAPGNPSRKNGWYALAAAAAAALVIAGSVAVFVPAGDENAVVPPMATMTPDDEITPDALPLVDEPEIALGAGDAVSVAGLDLD